MAAELNVIIRDIVADTLKKSAPGISETMRMAIANSLTMKLAAAIMVPKRNSVLSFFAYGENECPGHVASKDDAKVCARCGVHIDSLRPPEHEHG